MTTLDNKFDLETILSGAIRQYCFDTGEHTLLHVLIEDMNTSDKTLTFLEAELNAVTDKDYFWHLQKSLLMLYQSVSVDDRFFLMHGYDESELQA